MAKPVYALVNGAWVLVGAGSAAHTHDEYLTPAEVVAGTNVSVDTTTTPGSVIVNSTASGSAPIIQPDAPSTGLPEGTLWIDEDAPDETISSDEINSAMLIEQAAPPPTPPTARMRIFSGTDGKLRSVDDAGNVTAYGTGGTPTGGATGQVLAKISATDYDTAWINQSSYVPQTVHAYKSGSLVQTVGTDVYTPEWTYLKFDVVTGTLSSILSAQDKFTIPTTGIWRLSMQWSHNGNAFTSRRGITGFKVWNANDSVSNNSLGTVDVIGSYSAGGSTICVSPFTAGQYFRVMVYHDYGSTVTVREASMSAELVG